MVFLTGEMDPPIFSKHAVKKAFFNAKLEIVLVNGSL